MRKLKILNWQNRRATDPVAAAIAAFCSNHAACAIEHETRPLSDFEHQSIEAISRQYDLIVYDHPFSGTIAKSNCFVPLEELLPDELGSRSAAKYIGPSLATYRFAGHVWGAPIDGATQHALYRRDLLEKLGQRVPQSHEDVLDLGRAARKAGLYLGTAIETPHALMSIFSYMANLGRPVAADDDRILNIPSDSFDIAFQAVADILELSAPEAARWNSIELHEAMVARDDIVYTPVVYGYATYGEEDQRVRLGFAGFAGMQAPFEAGSTIGGTALGLSRYCTEQELAVSFVRYMLSDPMQSDLICQNHGQPAGKGGWTNADNDSHFNGFYSSVRSSMETCWVRPRFHGYVEFQRRGGEIVAEALRLNGAAEDARKKLLALSREIESGRHADQRRVGK